MKRNISVIIIARNEPLIEYTLRSLEYQALKPYEVIVVVDSFNDISAEIARKYMGKLPIKVIINDVKPGYGGARRKGVEEARGSILVFIDADALAPPWWLHYITRDLDNAYVVAGPAITVKKSDLVNISNRLPSMLMPSYCENSYTWFAPTQNLAFRREVLEVIGNFDEELDIGGEDYDFCLRLKKAGISILYDNCAYVFHAEHEHKLNKAWRDGKARAKVFLKHGIHAVRDAIVNFFHGLALLSLPLIIALFIIYKSPFLFIPILTSLAHRLYRAFLMRKNESMTLWHAVKYSLMDYVSHIAFTRELAELVFYHALFKRIKG
jgi:glycosyltransferase involved in cell wall biosynthesis